MASGSEQPELLLEQARDGDAESLDRLLHLYRNYLQLLAHAQLDNQLRAKLDPSDLVQETLVEAYRDFAGFQGSTERELMAWLRRVLARNLADQAKHHRSQKRDLRRQQSLEAALDRSSVDVERALAAEISTPSQHAAKREQAVVLADAMARLPADYREVIIFRQFRRAKFPEIADRMGRSSSAVRMLWARALERLREELEGLS